MYAIIWGWELPAEYCINILTSSTKERLEQLEETKRELEARIAEEKLAKPKVTEEFIGSGCCGSVSWK